MTFRLADDTEIKNWNESLQQNPDGGNVFSSKQIAETKSDNGWLPRYIVSEGLVILALEKRIPLLGKFWYLPKGPGVTTVEQLAGIIPELKSFARTQGVFTLKIEPEIVRTETTNSEISRAGLVKTFAVQPNAHTVLIDLKPNLDDIMTGLNQKGRHAIRRAERDGVTAQAVDLTEDNMKTMYSLLKTTAEGQWQLRGYEYFKEFWTRFSKSGNGQMFFAYYQDELVAASYGLILGKKALYKDGCSVRERTAYGASHLLQWRMIEWMKSQGAEVYDLCGTPPSESIKDPNHAFSGLARFKTSFNKTVTDYVGCYSLPVKTFGYKLWSTVVERVVLRLHRKLHHTEWY